jgi:ribosome maturation factor RimP
METDKILESLKAEIRPLLDELRAEIVEISLKKRGNNLVLRLLVDKEGGINVDECALINQRLGDILEEKPLINEKYLLEVSSPGVDRLLKTRRDFERVAGEEVEIWLLEPVQEMNFLDGIVKEAADESVIIESRKGQEICLPYSKINKARLKIKY